MGCDSDYSSIFIDLVDNYNQLGRSFPSLGISKINDQVFGYSMTDIESKVIKYSYGLSSLKNNLKSHKPAGVSDSQIDLLFINF